MKIHSNQNIYENWSLTYNEFTAMTYGVVSEVGQCCPFVHLRLGLSYRGDSLLYTGQQGTLGLGQAILLYILTL